MVSHPYVHPSSNVPCRSPLSEDSTALRSPYHRFSRPTPPALLNVTHIVSEEQAASRSSCYFQARLHSSLQECPSTPRTRRIAPHHAGTARSSSPSTLPPYFETGHGLSLSLPLQHSGALGSLLLRNSLPNIDGSTMTLAHWLQHFDTRVYARCFWAREWDAHAAAAPRVLLTETPIVTRHHMNLPMHVLVFGCVYIFLPFSLKLLVLRRSILTVPRAISTPTSTTIPGKCTLTCTPPRGERLPVGFLIRLFYFLFYLFPSFLPLSPIRLAQTDSANMALPKAQVSGESLVVLLLGRLSPDNNLGLLIHAFAGLSP
ncbi:hypothetical protein B0H13DRAFT_2312704 [Mycena leptocephala]|nr:hypothetical protein B0H13DRAFT_2312704 [Mycena leptocephala]